MKGSYISAEKMTFPSLLLPRVKSHVVRLI